MMRFEPFHTRLLKRYIEAQKTIRPGSSSEVREAEGGVAIYDALGVESRLILEDTLDCGDIVLTLLKWLAQRMPRVRMDLSPLTMGVTPQDLREMGCIEKPGVQVFVRSTSGHDVFRKNFQKVDGIEILWPTGPLVDETSAVIARAFNDGEDPSDERVDVGRTYALLGEHLAILDGGNIVAGGAVFVEGETAYLSGGSVLPSHRGRGLQEQLIHHRIVRAFERGAKLAWVTAAPGSKSERNLLRAGFTPAYHRAHFTFQR